MADRPSPPSSLPKMSRSKSGQSSRSMTREESGRKGLSGMIILAGDQSVRILYASPSMEDVLGYTEEEFLHLSHRDLYHPDEAPLLDNKLEWTLASQTTAGMIFMRLRHRSGGFVRCCLTYSVVHDQIIIVHSRAESRPAQLKHPLTGRDVYETVPPDTPGGMWSMARWAQSSLGDLPRIIQTGLFVLAQPVVYLLSRPEARPRTFFLLDRFSDLSRITYVSHDNVVCPKNLVNQPFYSIVRPSDRPRVRQHIDQAKKRSPVIQDDEWSGQQDQFDFMVLKLPDFGHSGTDASVQLVPEQQIIRVQGIVTAYSDGLACLLIRI